MTADDSLLKHDRKNKQDQCTRQNFKDGNDKYEDMAVNYYPSVGCIAVAFWDLNNLKMIKDNFGHAVGDSLIQTMSEKLLAVSNERCRTYRVGGDEFLLILDDPAPGEINRIIQQVKTELSSGTGTIGLRILAAVGSAEGCGADIRSLVKKADAAMYSDKAMINTGFSLKGICRKEPVIVCRYQFLVCVLSKSRFRSHSP